MSAKAPPNPDHPPRAETLSQRIIEGEAPETTETNIRWAAYANRIRTIMNSAHRYVAYTSDIGESFRPVAHPGLIRTAYGISWLYLTGDVLHEGYKAYISNQATLRGGQVVSPLPEWLTPKSAEKSPSSEGTYKPEQVAKSVAEPITTPKPPYAAKPRKVSPLSDVRDDWDDGSKDAGKNLLNPKGTVPFLEDYRTVMVQRAIFQGLASMGLPALTIHTVVRYSGRALKNAKNTMIRTWGPVGLGLAVVPALPYIFDHPVEHAVEYVFEKGYETITGKKGVHEKEL
ncbi:uncharacterized protein H6S33_001836 [Morchella sextelata]|uniref:uncharacterized protein n=1 Tax=Morchella sextelata TaxID=1174677 RepID=UPI001D04D516|nr:uncharacterized protein H6S33_001836 [Morchella sextelata]KAH0608702.1 hypothetical protein H6S33_001836 [Morchella sextelata]